MSHVLVSDGLWELMTHGHRTTEAFAYVAIGRFSHVGGRLLCPGLQLQWLVDEHRCRYMNVETTGNFRLFIG